MTKRTKRIIIILGISIFLLAFGIYNLGNFILKRYSPPEINVTKNEIISSEGFMNSVTIERLKVDSFGKEKRPTKYTIEYITTCSIKQKNGEAPVALKEIRLNETGRYSWSEENVHISIIHPEGLSNRTDPAQRLTLSMGHQNFSICPLKFERENWYFINFQDPVFIGVYIYVDKTGTIHQYAAYSRILPT